MSAVVVVTERFASYLSANGKKAPVLEYSIRGWYDVARHIFTDDSLVVVQGERPQGNCKEGE